jgi:hypothetical protein
LNPNVILCVILGDFDWWRNSAEVLYFELAAPQAATWIGYKWLAFYSCENTPICTLEYRHGLIQDALYALDSLVRRSDVVDQRDRAAVHRLQPVLRVVGVGLPAGSGSVSIGVVALARPSGRPR